MHNLHQGFELREKDGVKYLVIPAFEESGGVYCAFSTRIGGVSPRPFNTLNFSRKREQSIPNFNENMSRFAKAVGFNYSSAVAINYAHSDAVYRAETRDAGCGIVKENVPSVCDGLYTEVPGLALVTFHADCAPLFFYDPVRRAVAGCHAGWKGITKHITVKACNSLLSIGSRAEDIMAAVGPAISVKNYEISKELAVVFIKENGEDTIEERDGKLYADLEKACVNDMLKCGIREENITVSGLCTYDREDLFFSHRRDNGRTGAMAGVISLK